MQYDWLVEQCQKQVRGGTLILDCPNVQIASALRKKYRELAEDNSDFQAVKLTLLGVDLYPPFSTKGGDREAFRFNFPSQPVMQPSISTYSFQKFLDDVNNSSVAICLTDHKTHDCVFMNNQFEPGRLVLPAGSSAIATPRDHYSQMNFLAAWRDSKEQFYDLLRELNQQGRYEKFRYRLRRPDGSLAEFVKDYELREILGTTVRMSISHEWKEVEPAPDPVS